MDSAISDDLLGIAPSATEQQQHDDENNIEHDQDQLVQEENEEEQQQHQTVDSDADQESNLQQDQAAITNKPTPTATAPQDLTAEQPADPLPLLLLKRELAKILAQLNAKALEIDQVKHELDSTKTSLVEEKKKYELLAAATNTATTTALGTTAVSQDAAAAAASPQQQASFKKLETVFAAAASASSSANPTFFELVCKSESLVRENLLLQERVDFLENTNKAFKTQALVWKKVATNKKTNANNKNNNSSVSSSSLASSLLLDAKAEQQVIAKFPSTPEVGKLKQLCAQVTDLLKERAAVAADEGDWRGVVASLKEGLSSVLAEYETVAKQSALLRAALHRGASYCVEATNDSQDANAIAADASIRAQFVSGMLALKGVNQNNNNNSSSIAQNNSQDSTVSILYYRSLLASLIANNNNNNNNNSSSSSSTSGNTNVPSWQQQQSNQLPSTSELAFLRRLVTEYNAKCTQLEQQNREYKAIALNCANFFSTTTAPANKNHGETSVEANINTNSSKNSDENNNNISASSVATKKVLEMWRSSTFELLKIATEMADKSSIAPFFYNQQQQSSSSSTLLMNKDISYPVLFAKCSALENQVALQNATIHALNSLAQQLSILASSSSLWLPSVVEACIPSSTTTSSGKHSNDNDDAADNNTAADISNVVTDLQSLLATVQESLNDTITNYDDISEDLRSQYETQIQNLEHWYSHHFDAQRLRTNALIQMVRTSDAIVAEVCGIEPQQNSNSTSQQQFWSKFMSNHNQKFSLLGSRNNPKSVSWISAAFGEAASKQQTNINVNSSNNNQHSSISTILEHLEKSVKSVSQEFKARRAQMEKKLDFFSTSDDTQLQRQILALQDQAETTQAAFDKEREDLIAHRDSVSNELDNKKSECQEWEAKYFELSARYDKMKADAENIMQTLLAEQEKAAKLKQELSEQEEYQQQQQEINNNNNSDSNRHHSIGATSKSSAGGANFVVEEIVEDDDDDELDEDNLVENEHHEGENVQEEIPLQEDSVNNVENNGQEAQQQQQQQEKEKSKSRSKSGAANQQREDDEAVPETAEEEGGANPFATSLF